MNRIDRISFLHLVNPVNPVLLLPGGYDGPLILSSRRPGASEWVRNLRQSAKSVDNKRHPADVSNAVQ